MTNQELPLELGGFASHQIQKNNNDNTRVRHYTKYGFVDLQLLSHLKDSPSPKPLKLTPSTCNSSIIKKIPPCDTVGELT